MLATLGATEDQMAAFFGVGKSNFRLWYKRYPAFGEAVLSGKRTADDKVEESLYRKATGYSHDAVKIFADPKTGAQQIVPYVERFPPDTTACIFWLKNRRAEQWRDVKAVEHSGTMTHKHVSEFTDEELEAIAAGRGPGVAEPAPGKKRPASVH